MATVSIYLNAGRGHRLDGYHPTHPVWHVFTYQTHLACQRQPEQLADDAFNLFNAPRELIDPAVHAVVDRYRAAHLRSLSVGDLVRVDGHTWLACAPADWVRVEAPPRVLFDHAGCAAHAHDRDPGTAVAEGQPVDRHGRMLCRHCQQPLMFCHTIGDYDHADPDTPPCFLIGASVTGARAVRTESSPNGPNVTSARETYAARRAPLTPASR